MCGIAGFVEAERSLGRHGEVSAALVHRMCDVIRHRGPDDEGIHVEAGVGLGMRRLSIIDLSTGHQPIHNEDRSVWLVFNGEIYNYQELRGELEAAGHVFYTSSDTETIVHAYEQWGEGAFARLRGMFGIALWDRPRRTLLLARDRAGIKPLHFAERRGRLFFGSEIKSLLAAGAVDRELDPEALDHYLSFLYAPRDRSHLQRRAKAAAGHFLRWRDGRSDIVKLLGDRRRRAVSRQRERRRDGAARGPGRRGAIAHGQRRAARRVPLRRRRLEPRRRADGGSVQPAGQDVLDRLRRPAVRRARARARRSRGTSARIITSSSCGRTGCRFSIASWITSTSRSRIRRRSRPGTSPRSRAATSPSCCPATAATSCSAATIATCRTRGWRSSTGGISPAPAGLPARCGRSSRTARGGRISCGTSRAPTKAGIWIRWRSSSRTRKTRCIRPACARALASWSAEEALGRQFTRFAALPPHSRMMRFDFETYLPEDVLTKVDRMSMAHSIESRVPLLDNDVIDFAATLPLGSQDSWRAPEARPERGGAEPAAGRHHRSEEAGIRRAARRLVPRRPHRRVLRRPGVAAHAAARLFRARIRGPPGARAPVGQARSHAAPLAADDLRALAPALPRRAGVLPSRGLPLSNCSRWPGCNARPSPIQTATHVAVGLCSRLSKYSRLSPETAAFHLNS